MSSEFNPTPINDSLNILLQYPESLMASVIEKRFTADLDDPQLLSRFLQAVEECPREILKRVADELFPFQLPALPTKEVVESFTTEPHGYVVRGIKTVRSRSLEFIETLQIQQVKEMPVEKAKDLFQLMIDVWDEKSLKRYFGTQAHREVQKINERKQYLSGTVVQATIELSHDVKKKEGYLERLGLVHYELRGKTVFMVLENAALVPELMKSCVSNDNFSLPLKDLSHKGKGAGRKPICEGVPHTDSDGEKRERVFRGGEKSVELK